jgi:antitoxin ParD1/3/4
MHVSLPMPLKQWVEGQVASKGYGTASEFVRDLLRQEQERQAQSRIDSRLTDAINSGPSTPMTRQDWQDIARECAKRARSRRKR